MANPAPADTRSLDEVVRGNIRAELARKNLKLLHLRELGWSESSVYRRFEEEGAGDRTPFSIRDIQRVADLLGISTDRLTQRDPQ